MEPTRQERRAERQDKERRKALDNRKSIRLIAELSVKPKEARKWRKRNHSR